MKKLILLSTLLLTFQVVSAEVPFSLTEGECAFVYSLPKTELCIELKIEKVTHKPGMFYRYSERYLATNKVITQEKNIYRLKSIEVKTRAIPDVNRIFKFISTNYKQNHLAVNYQGLLCGVNVPITTDLVLQKKAFLPYTEKLLSSTLLPLGEEYMMAGSEAKLAEGAAKQIYRIRESRLSLLTADVERLPADGASFSSMLEGLNIKECELTELFVGKITTETQTQTLYLIPDSVLKNKVIFRFSALRGIVSKDDLSGVPYYISIIPTIIKIYEPELKEKKEKAGLYSVLPASTQVTLGDGKEIYFETQLFLPQFGKIIPISENLFKQPDLKIRIDSQTGRLLSIE